MTALTDERMIAYSTDAASGNLDVLAQEMRLHCSRFATEAMGRIKAMEAELELKIAQNARMARDISALANSNTVDVPALIRAVEAAVAERSHDEVKRAKYLRARGWSQDSTTFMWRDPDTKAGEIAMTAFRRQVESDLAPFAGK